MIAASLHEWLSFILLKFQPTIINMIAHADWYTVLVDDHADNYYFLIIFADNYQDNASYCNNIIEKLPPSTLSSSTMIRYTVDQPLSY